MKEFNFNNDVFDFWPIFKTISNYYPIGISLDENSLYNRFPGSIERVDLIHENIHDNNNFKTKWKTFEKHVKINLKKKVVGATYGLAPSFSSEIILSQMNESGVLYSKELHFTVSLLGPYYTIYGLDSTAVQLRISDNIDLPYGSYMTHNAITVSPFAEFKVLFTKLKELIKERFPEYKFVPFEILQMSIHGLKVDHCRKENCRIFNALFNDNVDLDGIEWRCRGDRFYGFNEWKI